MDKYQPAATRADFLFFFGVWDRYGMVWYGGVVGLLMILEFGGPGGGIAIKLIFECEGTTYLSSRVRILRSSPMLPGF